MNDDLAPPPQRPWRLAVIGAVLSNLARFYGEDRYRVSPLIQQRVFAGKKIHD